MSDRSTKFYHSIIKRNWARNHITSTFMDQVSQRFVKCYIKLLSTHQNIQDASQEVIDAGSKLTEENAQKLTQTLFEEEIKAAIFCIDEDKAYGQDGYTSQFFNEAWEVVGQDINNADKHLNSSMLLGNSFRMPDY